MKNIQKLKCDYNAPNKDIWADSDVEISEERSECKAPQTINYTRQFKNTLKNNKGKLKPKDLCDFVCKKTVYYQRFSAMDPMIKCIDNELDIDFDFKESKKDMTKLPKGRRVFEKTTSTLREGTKILSDLREVPSFELLKVIR
ncbi:unnamed protein product [Moneuplotes crassus]|uniref:Uncharacterized protein n=1 Tax=Euplotes crassus TaxID=5936 RepID=A0AAD1UGJ2_EUPCR|nr:unnamed protein product [Moneuplotes crassus]